MPPITLSPVVRLGGRALTVPWQDALREIRVEREFQLPGQVTLRFSDPGYALAQSGSVSLATSVTVLDPSGSPTLLSAEVTSVSVEQRPGEQPELVVVGHDKSHRLGRATTLKSYMKTTYSDVVRGLATTCGLTAAVDSTQAVVDYLMQVDSDLGLLTELARRVGFDWWVEGSTLNFKKPAAGSTVTLALGDPLRSFSVRASGHHPDQVTVDGWDRTQQTLVTGTADNATSGVTASSTLADLVDSPGRAFGTATLLSVGLAAQSQTEADQLSQALYDRGRACSVTARGLTDGNGAVVPGCLVHVTGAGPLSGTYPVTRVEHLYGPRTGYLTRFVAGERRPTTLVDTLAGGIAAARPATHHAGLTVGQVTNINDPNSAGRVKVRYPGASSADETGWARVVSVGGGVNRGTVFIPEVDDEVLVGFEGGDPRQPVVIGGLYGAKSTIPTPDIANGKVQTRALTSRLGHVVTMLDGTEPAQQAIELQLAGKQFTLHLGKDQVNLSVPQGTPVNVVAGQTSIKFGDDGSMTMAAPSISIQATGQLELSGATVSVSAKSDLSLQGQGSSALSGGVVQVKGNTAVTIAGSPVAIN